MDFTVNMQKQTEHKLHLKHVCSPYGSPQSSQVNAEHTETLLEAQWMNTAAIYTFYLPELSKNKSSSFFSFYYARDQEKYKWFPVLCWPTDVQSSHTRPYPPVNCEGCNAPKSSAGHSGLIPWHKM